MEILFCHSQTFDWAISQHFRDSDAARNVGTDDQGNIYISGDFYSFHYSPLMSSGCFIAKYSSSGSLIWTDTIPGAISIWTVTDKYGNIYATGRMGYLAKFGSTTLSAPDPYYYGFLAKFNSLGNCLWVKRTAIGTAIALSKLNEIYVTGNFGFIAKCDTNGNVLWTKNVNAFGDTYYFESKAISVDYKGNVYITGNFHDSVLFGDTMHSEMIYFSGIYHNIFSAKYNVDGDFQWVRTPILINNGIDNAYDYSITADSIGNCYLAGNYDSFSPISFGDSTYYSNYLLTSSVIAKYDTNGNLLWSKSIRGSGRNMISKIFSGVENNIYITGSFWGTTNYGNGIINNGTNTNTSQAYVLKYNIDGEAQWAIHAGGDGSSGYSLCQDNNLNIYTVGYFGQQMECGSNTLASHVGYPDVFLTKISQQNAIIGLAETTASNGLSVFPNPTDNLINITCSKLPSKLLIITVKNQLGQTVYSTSESNIGSEYQKSIDLSQQNKGIYFIEIIADDKRVVRKVILQ